MDLNELFARKEELLAVSIEPHGCESQLQVRTRVVTGGQARITGKTIGGTGAYEN